ncbi:MAG: hypothetical protein Kow0089_07150 [Desulfobulbaceae bacterium]
MCNLFAYGTLLFPGTMREVAGCSPHSVPAVLPGYARRAVRGEQYPAILPEAGNRVEGLVYLNVPATAWERLDRYEGKMYVRTSVRVILEDGTTVSADTYVIHPDWSGQLELHE